MSLVRMERDTLQKRYPLHGPVAAMDWSVWASFMTGPESWGRGEGQASGHDGKAKKKGRV